MPSAADIKLRSVAIAAAETRDVACMVPPPSKPEIKDEVEHIGSKRAGPPLCVGFMSSRHGMSQRSYGKVRHRMLLIVTATLS
jgi:hypothetical protein